ncbi:MAG: YicC/YloC family endoribonuclease [Pseudomonadota bacterium]
MLSMTAFAGGREDTPWGQLSLELRSLNHRYLELHFRLPEELKHLEPVFRERLSNTLGRGKVDVSLRLKPVAGKSTNELRLNEPLLAHLSDLAAQARKLVPETPLATDLDLLRWPGVVREPEADIRELKSHADRLLESVLEDLVTMRGREGERLEALIRDRLAQMAPLVTRIREALPDIRERLIQRLKERIEQLAQQVDQDRLEQEVAVLLQRMDVDEELDRLEAHLGEVTRQLTVDGPVGRRLDFLMQELHREANTLGSKSADQRTSQASVDLKVLIEQMREQVQNIE